MTLKQSNYKSITALLLILVIAVGAVWAPLYVEASHGHDCSGTACPVCLTVSVIGSCLNYVLPALLPCLVTAITYFGLTKIKGMNTVKMVWILIVVTILLSYFGVIA